MEEQKEIGKQVQEGEIVDWSKYKEADEVMPKTGDKADGVVIAIKRGKVKELLPEELLEKWKSDHEAEAIEVEVEYAWQNNTYTKRKILTLPNGDIISRKSNLYKWKKAFGDYPRIGQKIYLIADGEGYFQIKL